MKKRIITILLVLTLVLSSTSSVLAAPFDLTYSVDSTKNYTLHQFNDSPIIFDFVAANLAGYEIEALDGTKYNAQEMNNKIMVGMTFVQAIASLKATAAVETAEGSLLQADVDAAQSLITALPDGTDKTVLQARLDIVIASMPVTPPAPTVTRDDVTNTVSGMETGMEYNLDNAGYVAYVAATFNALDFSGNHTLLVRVAAEGNNPYGPDTTLTFTTNPAPPVTNNDVTDTVSGMTTAMEYSYDGAVYVLYEQFDIAWASLDFEGEHTLVVRYAANPTGSVTTLVFTTRPGPSVTNNDVTNTVTGMASGMEYKLDNAGYVNYVLSTFNALDFNGEHTLLVRYPADFNWTLPSKDTTLNFTTNPGPNVTNDDVANTVTGMTIAMEYKLDTAEYVLYDATTFASLDFSGDHILLVRYAANPTGPEATLIFTTNPVAPAAPLVTNNDVANTVSGMAVGMEYNYDGFGYVVYEFGGFEFAGLDFTGDHTLDVRYAAVGTTPASLVTTLTFTTNPLRPGPPLIADDVANTVLGTMDIDMEYSYDGAPYVPYNSIFSEPDATFNALDLTGNVTLLVRYAEDFMNNLPASLDTILEFTTKPDVTNDDDANTVTGMTTAMEYNLDNAGYVTYDAQVFGTIDFSGNHSLLVRYAAEGINPAGPDATLTFTTNPVIPPAPQVTNDDDANTVTGMEVGMEYNLNGAGYVAYVEATFNGINFSGDNSLLVRVAAESINPAGPDTTLTFTANPVTGVIIKTEPTKTVYSETEGLDLTGLVVTLTRSDVTVEDVDFAGFTAKGITTVKANGEALIVTDTMVVITVNGVTVNQPITVTATVPELAIGDVYGGGKVAYILQAGDPGYIAGEQHGLIAATSDQGAKIIWAVSPYSLQTVETLTTMGSGALNTDNIIAQNGPGTTYAAGVARAYNGGGYDDWYLPSFDELVKLKSAQTLIGGFTTSNYWSSSEYTASIAHALEFYIYGYPTTKSKSIASAYVRAVRNF